jgi:hypothetical protein
MAGILEEDLGIGAAHYPLRIEPEHAACRRIERHDLALEIEGDHPVGHVDENVLVNRGLPMRRLNGAAAAIFC